LSALPRTRIVITGMGVRTAIGSTVPEFEAALREGRSGVSWIAAGDRRLPAAMLPELSWTSAPPDARRGLRGAPPATQIGCAVAYEAMAAARLTSAPGWTESAIVVAGNNIHQRYAQEHYEIFRKRPQYLSPRYAVSFLDTNVVSALSEIAGLRGPGFTVGGSMASGNAALYQAFHLLQSGAVETCVAIGALADYGDFELQAFSNLGALSCATPEDSPAGPGAPFDRRRSGFVYGQGSGCVILETAEHARRRGVTALAELAGVSMLLDGHAASDPSPEGEAMAMRKALSHAGVEPRQVDYLNAHGTSTAAGDEAECEAIEKVFEGLPGPLINSTKELTGHTIYAAGIVECIATVVQMEGGFLHPNPNLTDPIAPRLRFVGPVARQERPQVCLSNAFSVGGINSSVVLRRCSEHPGEGF
jgi:malonyl-ACP decarboxylase